MTWLDQKMKNSLYGMHFSEGYNGYILKPQKRTADYLTPQQVKPVDLHQICLYGFHIVS